MMGPGVALVGSGWVVRTIWAPLLQRHGARIVSIIDPDPQAGQALAELAPTARQHACMSHQALQGCNVALICSPNAHHTRQALRAMEQGLHVILEKPACLSLRHAQDLIERSRHRGVQLSVTAAASHRSDVRTLLDAVASQAIGKVHCIDVAWRRRNGVPRPGSWFTRADQALAGSGADLGWHLLEVALQALGYPLVDSALCNHVPTDGSEAAQRAKWRADTDSHENVVLEVESQSYCALRTQAGAMVFLRTAWSSHQSCDETTITLYGSAGELRLHTTFGFSQNRVQAPSLVLSTEGNQRQLVFEAEDHLAPHSAYLGHTLTHLGKSAADSELEFCKLRSLASAMSAMYPNLPN
ncbi:MULTISPECIES: Gfo/Idh/MocA family oxidoreductase [Pseudomonas aeruginosa group]|nr:MULTISPECIES: Gfo/Idh/MocA family oxidoreductase [Pseudomonas aeruginosa group]MDV7899372.1 Gfo/Idh/MocA family oxidoreductase [Pseudomonas aeruginosa]MDY1587983.1 Gfo/Idh/MocA family oxidoreductase [Pseudomonas paraeruginosa]